MPNVVAVGLAWYHAFFKKRQTDPYPSYQVHSNRIAKILFLIAGIILVLLAFKTML